MKSMMTNDHLGLVFVIAILLAGIMILVFSVALFVNVDNSPVPQGPEHQAKRAAIMRQCQRRDHWLEGFKNRGVGRDWLDKTADAMRSESGSE